MLESKTEKLIDDSLENIKDIIAEKIAVKKDKARLEAYSNVIELVLKPYISRESKESFRKEILKISDYISKDVKYILVKLFVQLGQSDENTNNRTLDYRDKNNVYINLKLKIKNYIPFKSRESAERYKKEELGESDLHLLLEVVDGQIIF